MLKNKSVTIIGLGLIGGSLARAFKKYLNAEKIYAVGRNPKNMEPAVIDGVILKTFCDVNHSEVLNSDIIVICTPIKSAMEYIKELCGKVSSNCIVTDACSTKGEIINYVNNLHIPLNFIGGHPIAGGENSGYTASSENLFKGAAYILTRSNTTTDETFSLISNIVEGLGSICVELLPEEHDESVAAISHLPHIAAFLLVDLVRRKDSNETLRTLVAGGFKDITRIASSNAEMWENIFLTNKLVINKVLTEYISNLEAFKNMINNDSSEDLKKIMIDARNYRNSIPDQKIYKPLI